jgi:hypothetical protein
MKSLVIVVALANSLTAVAAPKLPLQSGQYAFQHKMAEQPSIAGTPVRVRITGHHILVISDTSSDVMGRGIIDKGILMWHASTREWIIGEHSTDRFAPEVGGCSAGPAVIDLRKRIYWSC